MVVFISGPPSASEFTNYQQLVATAEEVMGRAPVAGSMTLLTSDLNNRLRLREMLAVAEQTTADLPEDFLEVETLKVDGITYTPDIEHGQQQCTYSVNAGTFVFNPEEDAPKIWLRYYTRLAPIEDVDTNPVLSRYPDIYLWGIMAHHAALTRDEAGVAAWGPRYENAIAEARKSDLSARQGAVSMRPRPAVTVV